MRLTLTLPPAAEPVTLDQAKFQCKVRHSLADEKLTRAIRTARQLAEERTERALITQGWRQVEACAPAEIKLGRWPVSAITKVEVDGVELLPAAYSAELGDDPRLEPVDDCWTGKRVLVEFTAGYGAAGDVVPGPIIEWMLMQIANLYENSGSVVIGTINSELKFVDHLLDSYIVPR